MHTVLSQLLLRDRLEEDPEAGAIGRHETDLVIGFVDGPPQCLGPEARLRPQIVRIEHERDESRRHRITGRWAACIVVTRTSCHHGAGPVR